MKNKKALILIAHGSRVAKTHTEMLILVDKLNAALSDVCVKGAYMEIQEPTLEMAVRELVGEGAQEIQVLPLFVFKGKHMIKDIPSQVALSQEVFPEIKINLLPHIGESDAFVSAITALVRIS